MGVDTVPTGISTGVSGSLLGSPVANSVPANGVLVLAAGVYSLYAMGANTRYEVFDGSVWQILVAVGGISPLIYSDGINYRFANVTGVVQTATTIKIG